MASAARIARVIPSPSGWGAVTWKASVVMPWPASAAYTRAARPRPLGRLEDHERRALADRHPPTIAVERAARLGIEELERVEAHEAHAGHRVDAAGQRDV